MDDMPRPDYPGALAWRIRLEAGRSLREVAAAAHMSKSTLSRIEQGTVALRLPAARALDACLATGGLLESEVQGEARQSVRQPAARTYLNRGDVEHVWPAAFSGAVWIRLRRVADKPVDWRVALRWGPWIVRRSIPAEVREVTFTTGKSSSESAVPLWASTNEASDFTFGCDAPEVETAGLQVDLRDSWISRDRPV